MNSSIPAPNNALDRSCPHASDAALWQLGGTITRLAGDAKRIAILPNLPALIEAVSKKGQWRGFAAIMATPEDFIAEGRKIPVAWRRDGGPVSEVLSFVGSDRLW